jgi:tRNA (adenine57-N1/adenine58-N1)-methyltransferase
MICPPNEDNLITPGDLILIYLDTKRQYLVQAAEKLNLSSDLGNMNLSEIIGKPFGYAGETHLGKKYYCLRPSTADLMFKVKRTGSGALAMVLAKLVAPDGMVFSYERREEFIENAKRNIERAGYLQNVKFYCRDVAIKGFTEQAIDAVFLDVPEPWAIVPKATDVLKGGHHLVSWSPNVEQVKRTVDVLRESQFIRIRVSEVLEREILVRQQGVRPRERGITHTAYLVRAQKIIVGSQD